MLPAGRPLTSLQTSRRNLIRVGTIAASAIIAKATPAAAEVEFPFFFGWFRHRHHDGHGGDRDPDGRCFLKGTKIRTADGERNIEELAAGDLLPTVFGGTSAIRWIGRHRFTKSDPRKRWVKEVLPIRIARSALGPDLPRDDLFVTQTHALLIDGVLVAAGNLVNDTTITRHAARELDELEYFHIKLENHDVIYAEGAPCETLLDIDENAANFAEYLREYGRPTAAERPCAPLFKYGYRRSEIKSCIRSAISPWFDHRQPADIIRDKLDVRGIALQRQSELVG